MERTYTQEQLDIELLKNTTGSLGKTMERIEQRLDLIEVKLENFNSNMKQQYSNFTNYILGIYGVILTALLSHVAGWI
jgi:tetrahydromethanopterin S-methyltransferase subunit G